MKAFGIWSLGLALALGGCASSPPPQNALVKAASPCVDQSVQIYFEAWSADITPEGRAVIDAAAKAAKDCKVTGVVVIGLADAVGAPDANLELSKKRAASVSAALAANGLPAAEFRVGAAGQAGATRPDGSKAAMRRRVDVTLKLAAA
jgi:outer membrane protein OmpA-like peptidoglycan-associated protein